MLTKSVLLKQNSKEDAQVTPNETNENRNLPIAKNEDVKFSAEYADTDDIEAAERSEEADYRQEKQ
jgi:hypothetical protein